jgi:hypothetical protein
MNGGSFKEPERVREGDDTVELELTVAEQLELARAAEGALRLVPPSGSAGYDSYVCKRTRRIDIAGTLTFAVLVFSVTAATGWRMLPEPPRTPVLAAASPLALAPVRQPQLAPALVQVVNPFDSREVFELPAATSDTEARAAIADLLLQRARERLRAGRDIRRPSRVRLPAVAGAHPSEVFVTRVPGPDSALSELFSLRAPSEATE